MKYFTKEELEDITKELLENPTRETLKNLNKKYNGSTEEGEILVKENPTLPVAPMETSKIEMEPMMEVKPVVESISTAIEEQPIVNPIPNFNVPNIEMPKTEHMVNNSSNTIEIPSFQLPKLETPNINNQSNEPVSFSGNIFEASNPAVPNLMQTTDNFNSIPNTMPTTEVPVTGAPFFGINPETVNNPIPVGSGQNNIPSSGPTMFGQLEQNYM